MRDSVHSPGRPGFPHYDIKVNVALQSLIMLRKRRVKHLTSEK